jgi:hypothetical protein
MTLGQRLTSRTMFPMASNVSIELRRACGHFEPSRPHNRIRAALITVGGVTLGSPGGLTAAVLAVLRR